MKLLEKIFILLIALVCPSVSYAKPEKPAIEFYFYISGDTDIISIEEVNSSSENQTSSQGLVVFKQLFELSQSIKTTNTAFHFYIDTNEKLDLDSKSSQILRIKNSQIIEAVNLGETDSHDPRWVQELTSASFFNSKNKKRILIMWGHGQGWEGLSNFDHSHYLNNFDLLNFVNSSHGVWDAIIFDACQMGSIEVMLDLKDKAKFILASQFNFPADGINYENLAQTLQDYDEVKDPTLIILEDLQLQTLKKQASKKQFAPPVIYNLSKLTIFLEFFNQYFDYFINTSDDSQKEELIHYSKLITVKPFTDLPSHLIDVRAFYHQLHQNNVVDIQAGLDALKAVLHNSYGSISFSFETILKHINKKQLLDYSNRPWANLAPWLWMKKRENLWERRN